MHSVPCLCFHKCPSSFRLETELLTSPQLNTSQCSHTSSCKEWLFPFTLSVTADLELLVLIFSIYITSVSLPWKSPQGHPRICKITENIVKMWSCGVVQRYLKASWTQPSSDCSSWPCFEQAVGPFQPEIFYDCESLLWPLWECECVCTVTSLVNIAFLFSYLR